MTSHCQIASRHSRFSHHFRFTSPRHQCIQPIYDPKKSKRGPFLSCQVTSYGRNANRREKPTKVERDWERSRRGPEGSKNRFQAGWGSPTRFACCRSVFVHCLALVLCVFVLVMYFHSYIIQFLNNKMEKGQMTVCGLWAIKVIKRQRRLDVMTGWLHGCSKIILFTLFLFPSSLRTFLLFSASGFFGTPFTRRLWTRQNTKDIIKHHERWEHIFYSSDAKLQPGDFLLKEGITITLERRPASASSKGWY